MKAFSEIGFRKAVKFGWTTLLQIMFRLMIVPQLRSVFLRIVGAKIGRNAIIHRIEFFNLYRKGFAGFVVGDECFIGDGTLVDLAERVVIADKVTIAERVTILTHTNVGFSDHPLQSRFPAIAQPVSIGFGSFIGACATLLPGVRVGECAFVAAGSLLTKDAPPHSLVGGVPARILRRYRKSP
jgi:acetyltransferase-like isoleucine patch superfamily enzyme